MKQQYNFMSWEHRKDVQPKTISYPNEIEIEQNDLRLNITQRDITPSEQKKLLKEWINTLSHSKSVEQIYFYSRINQDIFNSVCQIKSLKSLFIKWSANSIKDFLPIKNLQNLNRLYIGSSSTITDLTFLKQNKSLEWLEIHEQKNMNSIEGIQELKNLKGLIMSGGNFGKQKIQTISDLHELQKLKYLGLGSCYIENEDLSPISKLKSLEYLDLPIYYPMSEFANLSVKLPKCDYDIKAYRDTNETCPKCNNESIVYPMNKRSRKLCKICDSTKVNKLIAQFEELKIVANNL